MCSLGLYVCVCVHLATKKHGRRSSISSPIQNRVCKFFAHSNSIDNHAITRLTRAPMSWSGSACFRTLFGCRQHRETAMINCRPIFNSNIYNQAKRAVDRATLLIVFFFLFLYLFSLFFFNCIKKKCKKKIDHTICLLWYSTITSFCQCVHFFRSISGFFDSLRLVRSTLLVLFCGAFTSKYTRIVITFVIF